MDYMNIYTASPVQYQQMARKTLDENDDLSISNDRVGKFSYKFFKFKTNLNTD